MSLGILEATSTARAEAFKKPQVENYLKKLEETIQMENINETMIFNMYETGHITVQNLKKISDRRARSKPEL